MNPKTPTFKQLLSNPIHFLAFGFGSGLSKKAPGTMGTLAAVPLFMLLAHFGENIYLVVMVLVILTGSWICGKTAEDLGVHDHGGIVWDEFAGYLLTMYWVDATFLNIVLGFFYFRIFDIFKPWPISYLDAELKGGVGIMVDDLVAAIMAAACLYLTNLWI